MIMFGKDFVAYELLLKTMFDVLHKIKTGFPYGCRLTKIFEFYQVDLEDSDKVEVTEFLNKKSLNMPNIFVAEYRTLYPVPLETQFGPSVTLPTSLQTSS